MIRNGYDYVNKQNSKVFLFPSGAHRAGKAGEGACITAHYDYVDGEIQTWPSYSKYSNIRVWA